MRARVTRWAYSPRTPQAIARQLVQLLVLLVAAATVVLLASGLPGHLLASGLLEAAGMVRTVTA